MLENYCLYLQIKKRVVNAGILLIVATNKINA